MKKHQNKISEIQFDSYVDDVIHNRSTTPPPDMDAELAMIVNALAQDSQMDLPDEDVQDRLWNQVLFMIHCQPDEAQVMPEMLTSETTPLVLSEQATRTETPPVRRKSWLQQVWSSQLPDGFQIDIRALVGIYQNVAVMVVTIGLVILFTSLLLKPLADLRTKPTSEPAYTTVARLTPPEANVFNGIVKEPRYFVALLDTSGIYPSTAPIGYPVSIKSRENSNNVHLPWMLNMFTIPQ